MSTPINDGGLAFPNFKTNPDTGCVEFPPRAEDTLLKNACRTLWHARVAGTAVAYVAASAPSGSDEVPF